jgi:hypothetical protein
MSVTPTTTESDDCAYCGDETPLAELVDGSYCSDDCADRHRGERLFRSLQYDHRLCFACFRWLKEVDKARPRDPECVIGFQYLTENAEHGVKIDTDIPRVYRSCTMCTCGSQHQDDYLRDQDLRETLKRLVGVVAETRREGQHEYNINARVLTETVIETEDWELALGRALE